MIAEIAGFGAALAAYATFVEPYRLGLTQLEFAFDRLPPQFDGFTTLHLSDLHFRKETLIQKLSIPPLERKLARLISGRSFDLIALTGDTELRGGGFQALRDILGTVSSSHGTYFVPGNGEYQWYDIDSFLAEVKAWGWNILRNESRVIEKDGARISIVGVDDQFTRHSDLPRALEGVDRDGFKLLLSHSPGLAREAISSDIDLMLSGHTHGGQVRLPVLGTPYSHLGKGAPRLIMGVYEGSRLSAKAGQPAGRTKVYVTRGVGMSNLYIRLFCPPELAVITLRRA